MQLKKSSRKVGLAALTGLTSLMLLLSACGGDGGGDSDTTASGSGSGESAGQSGLAQADQAIAAGYKGTERTPPTSGPAAVENKNIWVLSCVQAASSGCAVVTRAIEEAAKPLNWKITVVDGEANPTVYNRAIRQAVAANADGIIAVAIDCNFVRSSLEVAREAGIPVVADFGFDCDDPLIGGKKEYTASVNYGTKTIAEYFENWGKMQADYTAVKTDGDAQIIELNDPTYLLARYRQRGFDRELAKVCPECEIVAKVDIPFPEVVEGKAAQKMQTVLAQNPEADVLVPAYDAMSQGIAQAVKATGRELLFVGGEGYLPNLELIREGTQSVAVAFPAEMIGWAGADTMNRVLAGETKIPDQGSGVTIIDEEHNLPAEGEYWSPRVDYKAAFEDIWSGKAE